MKKYSQKSTKNTSFVVTESKIAKFPIKICVYTNKQ